MNYSERIQHLHQIDLFSSFQPEELEAFAERVDEITLAAGDILFHEGEPGMEMFILLQGSLKVYKEKRLISIIRPVGYVGEMAIIEAKPRSATVQALEPSMLLRISNDQFQEYFAKQPQSLVAMMKTLSQRLRHDTDQVTREFEKANILIHDMKNLLSVFLCLDMLKKVIPEEQKEKYIGHMQTARKNLALLMDEAMANAKRLERSPMLRQGNIVESALDLIDSELHIHPALGDKYIRVLVDGAVEDFSFSPLEIRRVLANLIINAAQASPAAGTITVRFLPQQDSTVRVSVIDNGSGIAGHFKEKVFHSHFTTKTDGNGLGLTSCRQIIEDGHRGKFWFEDNPQGGTIFHFTLPLVAQGR